MTRDPFVREKFTRESWRHLQSQNIEFTMKRLREADRGRRLIAAGNDRSTNRCRRLPRPENAKVSDVLEHLNEM